MKNKNVKKCLALALSATFLVSPSAFADKEGTGTIIGGIIGAIAGSQTGKSNGAKTRGTIIGGLIGALVGNRVGNDMDKQDRDAYERTSRECFDGPVGRDMNWQGNKYRGNVRSTREGYRNNGGRRQVCREFHSEIYRGNSVETVNGVVCRGSNGWEKIESREVIFDNGGYGSGPVSGPIGGGNYGSDYGGTPINNGGGYQNSQIVDLGFLSPVSRRTGGEYLTINLSGKNLRSVTLQSSGDKVRIYRVIGTSINGIQTELPSAQLNTFLFLGSKATFDLSRMNGQVVRLDILAEAWASGLGISISGETISGGANIGRDDDRGQGGRDGGRGNGGTRRDDDRRDDRRDERGHGGGYGGGYSQQVNVCTEIARSNSHFGTECVKVLAGRYIEPAADRVCSDLASSNPYNALTCAGYAADARFSREALRVCAVSGERNPHFGAECVKAIANKRVDERFVEGCITTASQNPYNGMTCVQGLVIGNL